MSTITSRDVIFRDSENIPIFNLPRGDTGSVSANDIEITEPSELFDVEFVVRGDLDGDGNQELIFASIDGSLVIIKNRGLNQYHFRYPGKLPLDTMICGMDIAPIYHHGSGSSKSTANGVYVLSIDGTLLVLSCEELKFLPSSPHYDYKCYDTSKIDNGAMREVKKSIFTGVAILSVLLEVSANIPLNCKCLRVIKSGSQNEEACSVIIAMGGLDRVHLFTYDLGPMRLAPLCPDIVVDAPVQSLDLTSHASYSYGAETGAVEAAYTHLAVVGLTAGTVLCYELPNAKDGEVISVATRADGAPPLPSDRPIGPAYVKVLPASEYLGVPRSGAVIFNQALHFVVAWLDGRVAVCSVERDGVQGARRWRTLLCLHTNQVLYKVDHFHSPLLDLPPASEQERDRQLVSCAAISWSGATFLFTVRLPVVASKQPEVRSGLGALNETTSDQMNEGGGEGKEPSRDTRDSGDSGDSGDGTHESETETVREREKGKAESEAREDETEEIGVERPSQAEAGFKDSPDHPDPVDAAEFLKDRMSDHGLRVERTNDTNDPIVSSAPPSTVVVMTRPEEWLEQFDNLVYFFDSRTLTGASASRNFCCAQQGASQALIYINVDGMCTAICNVASQLQAFSSKLR